ncbi:MAG: 50S ribosomal protein L23 [Gammaproteobacteria bacterium]|jgi:large subunit ribosomal protein L23
MNKERLMKILLSPQVSEKSASAADQSRQFTFKVTTDATKPEIAKAVELMFDVEVEAVRTINTKGKNKRFGAIHGRRADWKKAMVRLKEGHDIDFGGS